MIGGGGGQPGEGVFQPGPGVQAELLAGRREAGEYGQRLAAAVRSKEEPVLATNGIWLHGSFGRVVVDGQVTVRHVDGESRPLVAGIGDGFAQRTLRQHRDRERIEPHF